MASVISRRRTDSNQDENEDEVNYYIELESSDSELNIYESPESVQSIQAETTVSAKDSSDIGTSDTSRSEYTSEFEVASSSSHPWINIDSISSSSSSPKQINLQVIQLDKMKSESNEYEFSSENDSDSDKCINNKFYRNCAQCLSYNDNPTFRFCTGCYKIRKEFYPVKPKGKKRKTNKDSNCVLKKKIKCCYDDLVPSLPSSIDNTPNRDISFAHSPNICSTAMDSGYNSQSMEELNARVEHNLMTEKCITCLVNDVNALFMHGKSGHRCCCYKCAKRIWFETHRCPICRSRVNNVILILN